MKNQSTTVFTTRTVTYAEKAKRLLAQSAIKAYIVKLDPALSPRGCAFGIEFDSRHKDNVRQILTRNGVPFGE
ncbi:MAG: DUF3343 domain-containing protein [Clostridia bacterium]|nr:DUF3343 domain-containing protein [Clostridia bacterium]